MSNYTSEAKRFSPCSFCKNSQDRSYTSLYGLPEPTQILLPLSRGEEDWLRYEIAGKLRDLKLGEFVTIDDIVLGAEKSYIIQIMSMHGFVLSSIETKSLLDRLFVSVVRSRGFQRKEALCMVVQASIKSRQKKARVWGVPPADGLIHAENQTGGNVVVAHYGTGDTARTARLMSIESLEMTAYVANVLQLESAWNKGRN